MKIVIIGNHAAGLSAAETLRKLNKSAEITVISKEDVPPYSRCLIPYIVSGQKTVDDILFRPRDFYKMNNIKANLGMEVQSIVTDKKYVTLKDNKKISYDSLIIAAGGDPIMPDIPGMDKKGVFGFRTLQDAENIKKYAKDISSAVILGGGLVGIKAGIALSELGKKVRILVESGNILSQIIGTEEAEVVQDYLKNLGIELKLNCAAVKLTGKDSITGLETKAGEKIDCGLAVIGKGVNANKTIVKETNIKTQYGIIVDEYCMTNVKDVYAAGDVTQSKDTVRKENWINAIWPLAIEEGKIAAENIMGKKSSLRERTSMNSLSFHELSLISCGLTGTREKIENGEIIIRRGKNKTDFKKFIFQNGLLVGFVLVGNVANAGILTTLVRKQININDIKDQILTGRYDFGSILPLIKENKDKFQEPEFKEVMNLVKS